jgi:TPP-dependent pyruvate/acetoin dehydrogenase alpha subunit
MSGPSILEFYESMFRIRRFEEAVQQLSKQGRLPGFVHLYTGEEAIAAGACAALGRGDWITSTHRGHGHLIARGGDLRRMMAELMAKVDGYGHGKGGSMHIADLELGVLGANGIVAAGIAIATGAALAEKLQGSTNVALCFFGDGASNNGVFHESMNLAAVWSLPIVFLCENNGYTELTPMADLTACGSVVQRASAYGLAGEAVDGNDVRAVYNATEHAVAQARQGVPSLIEARTYRLEDHNEGLEQVTGSRRPRSEVDSWRAKDPVARARAACEADGISPEDIAAVEERVAAEVEDARAFGEASPEPQPDQAYSDGLLPLGSPS